MKKLFTLITLLTVSLFSEAQQIPKWEIEQLEEYIKKSEKPTIINFWATFCIPCIEEIPHLERLAKKYNSAGVTLLLVSLDLPEDYSKVGSFAQKRKFTSSIVFLDESNADVFCPKIDTTWSGAIPASLFVNYKKDYRKFFEDQLSAEKIEREIKAMIEEK